MKPSRTSRLPVKQARFWQAAETRGIKVQTTIQASLHSLQSAAANFVARTLRRFSGGAAD
jgi:hypothetical protein